MDHTIIQTMRNIVASLLVIKIMTSSKKTFNCFKLTESWPGAPHADAYLTKKYRLNVVIDPSLLPCPQERCEQKCV